MSQAQKQELIGSIIAGILVDKGTDIVTKAVKKGMDKVAAAPNTKTDAADAKKATPVVAQEVKKQVVEEAQAQAEHKLDAEPHWQSRNIWGAFVGLVTAANTIYIFWTDGIPQTFQEYAIPIGIIVASVTPLYSRFIAKKPLFR